MEECKGGMIFQNTETREKKICSTSFFHFSNALKSVLRNNSWRHNSSRSKYAELPFKSNIYNVGVVTKVSFKLFATSRKPMKRITKIVSRIWHPLERLQERFILQTEVEIHIK